MKSTLDFHPKFLASLASYSKEKFTKDLMAGIIVGIVALPLAIAFGIASGVSPEKGLITAIIGGFIVSFLGGNSVQIGGPTGAFIVIVYGIIQAYGLEGLAIATFMAGLILVLMGCFRLGTIIKFIPYPIVVGFTSGIALTIFATQIKDLLGLSMDSVPADFISKWVAYFQHIETTNFWSLGIGILSILIIAYTPRISNKIPGSLMAIILMTVLVYVLERLWGIEGIETIGDRFNISNEVPEPQALNINMETINQLLSPAFTIAVLGAIESLLSATVADGVTGDKTNSNTELIAQGAANIVVPFFGGIPVTGAIARTMTNINNGGRTPIAGIIHAIVLLLIFLFLMPLIKLVPMSCLAGVLIVVSYNMSGTFLAEKSEIGRVGTHYHLPAYRYIQSYDRHRNRAVVGRCPLLAPHDRDHANIGTPRRARYCDRNRIDYPRSLESSQRRGSLRDRRPVLLRGSHQVRRTDA